MRTEEEVLMRLGELKAASPAGGRKLFSTVESAVRRYFDRAGTLGDQMKETHRRVVFEEFLTGIEFEHSELLPELPSDYPIGYEVIGDVFAEDDVFEGIMTIGTSAFVSQYEVELQTVGSGGVIETYRHVLLETTWPTAITAAINALLGRIKAIEEFCLDRYYTWRDALLLEELGIRQHHWARDRRGLARRIYIERGWHEVIEEYGFDIYEPSYVGEL